MQITPEMEKVMIEAIERQKAFFNRHDISDEDATRTTGIATPAHRAWVKAVEREYGLMGKEVRVHLDTPLARKAFILGYRMALKEPPPERAR